MISLQKSSKGFGKKKMFHSRSRTELIFSLVHTEIPKYLVFELSGNSAFAKSVNFRRLEESAKNQNKFDHGKKQTQIIKFLV